MADREWRIDNLEERLKVLEELARTGTYTLGELRGRFVAWAAVIVLSVGVGSSIVTAWLLRPHESAESIEVREVLSAIKARLDEEQREKEARHR